MSFILVGDIGGTNARFQIFTDQSELVYSKNYLCSDFANFNGILDLITQVEWKIKIAVLAVAGPVFNGRVEFVNNPWTPSTADSREVEERYSLEKVVFLNDFEAAGYGCLDLEEWRKVQINKNLESAGNGLKVVLGPGTGFGEVYLTYQNGEYQAWPSEGGACEIPPHSDEEWEILKHLTSIIHSSEEYEQFHTCGSAITEMCVGGLGSFHIYDYYRKKFPELIEEEFDKSWDSDPKNKMRKMMTYGLAQQNKLCDKSVQMWLRFIAYAIVNSIYRYLPAGGIYMIGGITAKNFKELVRRQEELYQIIKNNVKDEILNKIPLYLVDHEEAGMSGSLWYAIKEIKKI